MAKKSGKKSFLDYFRVDSEDDYEEEYDGMEEDLFDDEEEEVYVKPKKVKKLKEKKTTSLDNMYSEPDYDNFDSAYTGTGFGQTSTYNTYSKPASSFLNNEVKEQNVVSFDKRQNYKPNSEVYVIKPLEFDDAQTVSDFLKAGKTIVINMEGVQIDPAQRIIDFIGGACYGLGGDLKAISANIFIAAPHNIEVSGDLRDEILNESTLSPQLGKY